MGPYVPDGTFMFHVEHTHSTIIFITQSHISLQLYVCREYNQRLFKSKIYEDATHMAVLYYQQNLPWHCHHTPS